MTAEFDADETDVPAGDAEAGSSGEEAPRSGDDAQKEFEASGAEETDERSEMENPGERLRASVARLQERLEEAARDLRARDAADSIRDGVHRYPVLSVLGAAAAGAIIARALGSSGRSIEAEDLREALETKLEGPHPPEFDRTEDAGEGDGEATGDGEPERGDAGSDRSWRQSFRGGGRRAGRELGDIVRESVQAAVLSVLTRKLNDWLGPRSD